jgi:hypothetical protein
MDADDRWLISHLRGAVNEIIQQLASIPRGSPNFALDAITMLFMRMVKGWRSVIALLEAGDREPNEADGFNFDACVLVRSICDASLQLEYIVTGDKIRSLDSNDLGKLYIEYAIVEKYLASQQVTNSNPSFASKLSKAIRESPQRAVGEVELQKEFDRVKPNYLKGSRKLRAHWYPGHLGELAEKFARREEYFYFFSTHNSAVHSGPLALSQGPILKGSDLSSFLLHELTRGAKLVRDFAKLSLSAVANEVLSEHTPNLLDVGGEPVTNGSTPPSTK